MPDDSVQIRYGTTVAVSVAELLGLLQTLKKEDADATLGVRAIFQLLQAHCTQLKHHALIQVLSNRYDDADGIAIRLGAVGPISPGASNGRDANRLPDGADDEGQRKRQRTGETSAYRTIVEDAMEEFIEHVQTGSRTRLEGYLGPIDPETDDPYVDSDGELIDGCEIAYRRKRKASDLIAWGEGTRSLTTRICKMFNLPPSDFDLDARGIETDVVLVCLSDAAKRQDFPFPSSDCCTFTKRLNAEMFSSVSDRDRRSIKFIIGLFGLVPCPPSELNDYNGGSPSVSDVDDDDRQVAAQPAWRIVYHS